MEIRDLRYFVAAAELGQLRLAAERVGRSQPALTKCIRRLEDQLGAALFERTGHRLHLTAVGQTLLVQARAILRAMDAAMREVTDIAEGTGGHLRVGAGSTTAECLLPGLFNLMLKRFPKVTFEVEVNLGDRLRQMLRNEELDLFIGALNDGDGNEFARLPVTTDDMVVAASASHRLAGRRVSVEDLVDERWLIPGPLLDSTQWLNQVFESRGLPRPNIQVQASIVVLLRRVVAQTPLLTFISRRDIGSSRAGALLREIHVPDIVQRRDLGILHKRNRILPMAAHRLITLTQTHGAEMLEIAAHGAGRRAASSRLRPARA